MTVVDLLRGMRQDEGSSGLGSWTMLRRKGEIRVLRTLGWISAGAGVLGLGLMVGRELRQRYKFSRRTPYDVYSHAGDLRSDLDFGVGI